MFFSIFIIPFPSFNPVQIPINKDSIILTFFVKLLYIFFIPIFIPSSPFPNRNLKLFNIIKSNFINIIFSLLLYLTIWMINGVIPYVVSNILPRTMFSILKPNTKIFPKKSYLSYVKHD